MKEKTLFYYKNGYNCSQCVLLAASDYYGIPLHDEMLSMLNGIYSGFGIGGPCSVLLAGVMVFGLLFHEDDIKRLRIRLFDAFMAKHPSMNCCELIKRRKNGLTCEPLVGEIADLIEKIIAEG